MSAVILKALWIYGLAAVLSLVMAAVIKLIVVLLNMLERKPAPAAAAAVPAVPARLVPALAAGEVPPDHLAAIAAAVYAAIGAARIVHIDDARGAGWSAEGRLAHHASHARVPHGAGR